MIWPSVKYSLVLIVFTIWNMPVMVTAPSHGTATITGDTWYSLIYQSAADFEGFDTVVVECAHATQITCDTGIYVFHIGCQTNTFNITSKATPVNIFPNPGGAQLHIRGALRGKLWIADASGIVVVREEISGTEEEILPVELLAPGLYFVSFQTDTGPSTLPVVISR